MAERSDELPEEAWREITVAQGSQGPRTYSFSARRVRPTSRGKPSEIHWAVCRRNLDGSELRCCLSNTPEETSLETLAWETLAWEGDAGLGDAGLGDAGLGDAGLRVRLKVVH